MSPLPVRLALFSLINCAFLLGLWLLFTGTARTAELLAGVASAALAAAAMAIVQGQRFAQFHPKPRWLALFLTEPWYALTGTWAIFVALARRILGRESEAQLKAVAFDVGGDDGYSEARRALAIMLTTIPPNFVVIGIDRHNHVMLIHQVSPTGVPWVAKQVGAHE